MPQERQVEGGTSAMCYRMIPVSIQAIGSIYDDVLVTGTSANRNDVRMIERSEEDAVQTAT